MNEKPTKATIALAQNREYEWNQKYRTGTEVFYRSDDGTIMPTRTRIPAMIFAGDQVRIWIELYGGIVKIVDLDRLIHADPVNPVQ